MVRGSVFKRALMSGSAFAAAVFLSMPASADGKSAGIDDFTSLTLEDLMAVEVTTASK